jgi:hypothetical protein
METDVIASPWGCRGEKHAEGQSPRHIWHLQTRQALDRTAVKQFKRSGKSCPARGFETPEGFAYLLGNAASAATTM